MSNRFAPSPAVTSKSVAPLIGRCATQVRSGVAPIPEGDEAKRKMLVTLTAHAQSIHIASTVDSQFSVVQQLADHSAATAMRLCSNL
jgi:hypothetical protein